MRSSLSRLALVALVAAATLPSPPALSAGLDADAPCPPPARSVADDASADDPLCRLLEGPAGLLLTPDERELVQTLGGAAERGAFVEWFWARRDPDPATARNEFRDEVERRWSFASRELGPGGGGPGNETPGMVLYLVLGPPQGTYRVRGGVVVDGGFRDLEVWVYDVGKLVGGQLHVPLVDTERGKRMPRNLDTPFQMRLRRVITAAVASMVTRPELAFREAAMAATAATLPLASVTLVRTADGLHGELRTRVADLYGEPWQDGVAYWLEFLVTGSGDTTAGTPHGALSLRVDAGRFRRIRDREIVIAVWVDGARLPADPVLEVRERCTGRLSRLEPADGDIADSYAVGELLGTGEFADADGTVVAFSMADADAEPGGGGLSLVRAWSELPGKARPWPTRGLWILERP